MDWDNVVKLILQIIDEIRKDYVINNMTIRDDIFGVLEKHCTVVYYPIENEKNCGFHTKRFVNDRLEDFVYINTAQPVSKQVFAAAHELGHVWGVAERVWSGLDADGSLAEEDGEKIINRFAAELLMPTKEFRKIFFAHVEELRLDHSKIPFEDMVRLIVLQMNDFMVPCEAVRRRLVETGIISEASGQILKEHMEIVEALVSVYSQEQNTTLDAKTMKKTIPGIRDLVEQAESGDKISPYVLAKIKKDFGIEEINSAGDVINITTKDE